MLWLWRATVEALVAEYTETISNTAGNTGCGKDFAVIPRIIVTIKGI